MQLHKTETKFFITDLKREDKYAYQNLTRHDGEGARTYNVGAKKSPSVTTMISDTQSKEKRAALARWREGEG